MAANKGGARPKNARKSIHDADAQRRIIEQAIPPEALGQLLENLIERAKAGDDGARRLALAYQVRDPWRQVPRFAMKNREYLLVWLNFQRELRLLTGSNSEPGPANPPPQPPGGPA